MEERAGAIQRQNESRAATLGALNKELSKVEERASQRIHLSWMLRDSSFAGSTDIPLQEVSAALDELEIEKATMQSQCRKLRSELE
mmetsp:Transcript_24259/g.61272  ORF Transcript_24259/g.61272 Transcript_24259/m.61272 type:complete len:86 (+) Transcript_24259:207-464(+)